MRESNFRAEARTFLLFSSRLLKGCMLVCVSERGREREKEREREREREVLAVDGRYARMCARACVCPCACACACVCIWVCISSF